MEPDISEFSYGFAITSELVHHYALPLVGAPRFPTQNEEGKVGGHDVELPRRGVPVFLQFKRSDCLTTRNSACHAHLGLPYYRFHLRPRRHSDQHELLLELEQDGNEVYYAAPRFHLNDELNVAYQQNRVAEESILLEPSKIGALPDDRDHYVAVSRDNANWRFCSDEPRTLEPTPPVVVLREYVRRAAREKGRLIDDAALAELGDRLVNRYVRRDPQRRLSERAKADSVRRDRSPAEFAREVSQMLYGCELFVAYAD